MDGQPNIKLLLIIHIFLGRMLFGGMPQICSSMGKRRLEEADQEGHDWKMG
jgi:hypothetical protein